MKRISVFAVVSLGAVALGCAKKDSTATPEVTAKSEPAVVVRAPAPAENRRPTAPAKSAEPAPAVVTSSSPARDAAARLLQNDGQGGWRKDEKAATELEKLNPEEVAQLWPLLKDSQTEVRRGAAVFLLGQFDPSNQDQVAAFSALLGDGDSMVRARALDAVRQFVDADKIAMLSRLRGMLDPRQEDRAENRIVTVRLLGSLKQEAGNALASLQSAASSDTDAKVRAAALAAIVQVADSENAVKPLAAGLADNDASVRLVAAARLRQMGIQAAPAAKQLAGALADTSGDVAEAAAEALIRIGSEAVEPLAGQLQSKSTSARKLALACLPRIGPAAKSAIPQIEKCKQDADPQVRQLAEAALKRIVGQ